MRRYCLEAIRINGAFGAYREAQTNITVNDAGRDINIKPGDKVFVPFVCFSFRTPFPSHEFRLTNSQAGANHDASVFPEPQEVRLDRPQDSYIPFGVGPQAALGNETSIIALTSMLRVVGGLDNLRRAPGPQGQLKKVDQPEGYATYLREDNTGYFPFPMSESPLLPLLLVTFLIAFFPCSLQGSLRW